LDYSGGGCGKLLLEPQRTNLIIYSTQITSNAAYLLGGTTNTSGQISPTGGTDAYLITENITTAQHFVDLGRSSTATNTSVTSSFFIKPNGRNKIRITNYLNLVNQFAFVELDLATNSFIRSGGTNVSYVSYSITDFSNGWKRVSLTSIKAASSYTYAIRLNFLDSLGNVSYLGDGTSGAYVYGAQQEHNAAYPTTLINTLGTAVTRVADACSKTGITSLIGQTEGTLFVDMNYTNTNNSVDATPFRVLGSGSANIYVEINTNETFEAVVVNSAGTLVFNSVSSAQVAGRKKIAIAYKGSDFAYYINGTQIAVQTSGAFASASLNTFNLGMYSSGVQVLADGVNQALLFTTRLTNDQLAELTSL
jgi:hypothetical protein